MLDLLACLISGLWIFLETVTMVLLLSSFLESKGGKIRFALGTVAMFLMLFILCNFFPKAPSRALACHFAYLIVAGWMFNGKTLSHLLIIVMGFILITLMDVLFINGFCNLIGIPYQDLIWFKRTYVILVTAGKLLCVFIAWMIRHIRNPGGLGQMSNKWLGLVTIFPVASLVVLYILFTNATTSEDVSFDIIVASSFLGLANIALLYIISALQRSADQDKSVKLLTQQMQIQNDNLKAMELNYRTQRKITHEFERYLQTMLNLLRQQEYCTVEEYIAQLQQDRALRIVSVTSGHPVIDAILNQKHQLAQESGIAMHVEVNDLSQVSIQTDQLVVLLANLLDNAIEACLRVDGTREIYCRIVDENGLYIAIRNTSRPVEIVNGRIPSSKADKSLHGYGLQAVHYVLSELQAEYTFHYQDGWFCFAAEIP